MLLLLLDLRTGVSATAEDADVDRLIALLNDVESSAEEETVDATVWTLSVRCRCCISVHAAWFGGVCCIKS